MPDSGDDFETRLTVLEREVARLRSNRARRLTKLDREMREGFTEMREGFSTVATGMAQSTALLTNIVGPERDGS
ncbi:MAG: hypothetical protein ACRDSR_11500 [Pseudonocardiaceae bacterium]